MEAPLVIRVLAASVCLAEKASSLIRTVYASKDLAIIDKGVNDFQSRADRDSQRCIVQSLNNTFPGLHIIGEEGELDYSELSPEVLQHKCPPWLSTLSTDDLVVWVDPLDGTKEFTEVLNAIKGLVEYVTVLIGIAAGGKPVGDTKKPHYITRVVWGLSDVGVFGVKPSLPSSQLPYPIDLNAPKLSLPHSIVVTRSHRSPTHDTVIKAFYPTEVSTNTFPIII
ncbi:unnamed protein product [Trichobilharzia regenti]|nr:unnamed protein product [Trichobilharzia regenti]